jgi:hypothetical protein
MGKNKVFNLTARKMINSYRPMLWMSFAMVVAAFGVPVAAQAQTVDPATAAKLDFLNDRLNAMLATGPNGLVTSNFYVPERTYGNTQAATAGGPPDGKPQFSFNILLPVNWDSNANTLPSGGASAFQFSPDLHLGATDHFAGLGGVAISGAADLIFNRYSNSAGTDASPVSFSFEIQHVSGQNSQEFQPFIAFSSATAYNADFSTDAGTVRKLYGGFDKLWDWGYWERGKGLERDPHDQSISNRFVSPQVGFSAQVGRSFATSSSDGTYLKVLPSVGYNFNNGSESDGYAAHWSVSLGANITRVWNDTGLAAAGVPHPAAERDWAVSPLLTLVYSPPTRWFRWASNEPAQQARNASRIGSPTITMQIAYSRFSSNVPGKSYDAWAIGPSLGASWKF